MAEGWGHILVVSPHFDDGVFGCGEILAQAPGAVVVTVFGRDPGQWARGTPWDRSAGFEPGTNVVARRRREDRAALAALRARPRWLPFTERQYGGDPPASAIAAAVSRCIRSVRPDRVFLPLGLWHSEHQLVHEAAVSLVPQFAGVEWFVYEDAIYRTFPDAALDVRLRALAARVPLDAPRASTAPASEAKRRAVACYASQLQALAAPGHPGYRDVFQPERYWRMRPRPA